MLPSSDHVRGWGDDDRDSPTLPTPEVQRYAKKLVRMGRFAADLADLATDPRIKVGCVVFPVDCSAVAGIGYNGAAEGLPHGSIRTGTAPGTGGSGAAHAEANALIKAGRLVGPHILYTLVSPCAYCAPLIANARNVVGVIYANAFKGSNPGDEILKLARIPLLQEDPIVTAANGDLSTPRSWREAKRATALIEWWRSMRPVRPQPPHDLV